LEGSIYMNEERWSEFYVGMQAIQMLEKKSAQDVYNIILARSCETYDIEFDPSSLESRALARLVCMCHVGDLEMRKQLVAAFRQLEGNQKSVLSRYLAADGISSKPAFTLDGGREFLTAAMENTEVGPLPAILIILKVCTESANKFSGGFSGTYEPVITIKLTKLKKFAQQFAGAVTFQDMPFDLAVENGAAAATVIPKVWIPVRNEAVLGSLTTQCRKLAANLLSGGMGEKRFKGQLGRTFPELAYFGEAHKRQEDQTLGALLSVYWLLNDQHDAFTRGQDEDDVLTKHSWAWIQDWISETLRFSSEETVDAVLALMAIHALGKIQSFREELAPEYSAGLHDVALAHILQNQPELVPSFLRLPSKYQSLIIDLFSVDFQFSQFLQAEVVPSNLVLVKEKLQRHGEEGFSFFCFRIFAQMSGKLGDKDLRGSIFMTESQFQRFRPGLDALQELRTLDAGSAYNAFLLLRGSKALSHFASPEHQALVRLLCLGSAYDYARGDSLCEAFDELMQSERHQLTRLLTADGITEFPGYVLCDAADLLKNAQANPAVGLAEALRALVRVQEKTRFVDMGLRQPDIKAQVLLRHLAVYAQEAGPDPSEFGQAYLQVVTETKGDNRIHTVQVFPQDGYLRSQSEGSCRRCINHMLRCCVIFIFTLLLATSAVGAAGLFLFPAKAERLLDLDVEMPEQVDDMLQFVQDKPRVSSYLLMAVAACSLIGLLSSCYCSQGRGDDHGRETCFERLWGGNPRTAKRRLPQTCGLSNVCSYSYEPLCEEGSSDPLLADP